MTPIKKTVYVATYLPTRNSSVIMTTSRRLWMIFILWLAVGFDSTELVRSNIYI